MPGKSALVITSAFGYNYVEMQMRAWFSMMSEYAKANPNVPMPPMPPFPIGPRGGMPPTAHIGGPGPGKGEDETSDRDGRNSANDKRARGMFTACSVSRAFDSNWETLKSRGKTVP